MIKGEEGGSTITGIIEDLRSIIDQISNNFVQAKALIRELARRLNEEDKCEKSEISGRIKEILAREIEEHKITGKWIEECLPRAYKRRYRFKSELASLSKKTKDIKVQDSDVIDTIDNGNGGALLINHDTGYSDSSDINGEKIATDVPSSKGFERQESQTSNVSTDPYQILKEENSELSEARRRQTTIVMGDHIPSNEMDFKIPKEKYDEVKTAMASSMNFCHAIFDKSGILIRTVPDIFKTN
jgi:hypothetical protein